MYCTLIHGYLTFYAFTQILLFSLIFASHHLLARDAEKKKKTRTNLQGFSTLQLIILKVVNAHATFWCRSFVFPTIDELRKKDDSWVQIFKKIEFESSYFFSYFLSFPMLAFSQWKDTA